MKIKKRIGITIAAVAAAGALGITAYGTAANEDSTRLTLGAEAQQKVEFGNITDTEDAEATAAADKEIDTTPVQENTEGAYLPNIKQITRDVMPAIVAITNQAVEEVDFFGRSYQQDTESAGSGIIVAKSETELLIATNNHVVEGADQLTVCFGAEVEDEKDKLVSAQVKGTDSSLDLAVIAVKLEDIPDEVADQIGVIQLGDSDNIQVGDWAIAIGNALGYGQSVTFGIISALDREVTVSTESGVISNNMLQTDAAINFGNSGGALLDENGRLIGINSAKAAESGVEGMGYAIPINTAKPIIEELMNQTTRDRVDEEKAGALGVVVINVSEEARQIYNVPAGAFVTEPADGGAAEKAGIMVNDIITKLEKTAINSRDELLDRMKYYEAGETIEVTVKRIGDGGYVEKVVEVTLDKKSDLQGSDSSQQSQEDDGEEYDSRYDENNGGYYDDSYGIDDGYGMNEFFRYFGF